MLYTCGNCKNLKSESLSSLRLYACSKTGYVVPHSSDENKAVFHRIPMNCPLSNSVAHKSDKAVQKNKWITIKHITKTKVRG